MVYWEIKKIIKRKNGILAIALYLILILAMIFVKPSKDDFWRVFNYRAGHSFMIVTMIIIVIVLFSNIYSDEIVSNVDCLILSSKNKYRALYGKLILSLIVPVILYSGYLVIQFIITFIQYGRPVNAGLWALQIVDNSLMIKEDYTIYEFVIYRILLLFVILISISILSALFSFLTKNTTQSMSMFLLAISFFKLITIVKFLPGNVRFIASRINYIDWIFNFNDYAFMYVGKIKIFSDYYDMGRISIYILLAVPIGAILLSMVTVKKLLAR